MSANELPDEPWDSDVAHLLQQSMTHVRQLFLSGDVSPVAVTRAALDRIESNERLGAFAQVDRDGALKAAAASEDRYRRSVSRGPLDGITISVKDIIAAEGLQWEAGSAVLSGQRAAHDAAAVATLRREGAVIVGKTALDEFALTTTGPVLNPVSEDLTAGGSSCGSAVAVRTGMSFADLATDTGGSVRIPAHCCHVTGLKPTRSLLPLDGVLPLAHSLDHLGIITRTVEDSAVVLGGLLTGGSPVDVRSIPAPTDLRIGVPTNLRFHGTRAEGEYWRSVQALESLGMRRVDVTLPDLDVVADVHQAILRTEMRGYHAGRFGRSENRYGPGLHEFIWGQPAVTAGQYLQAQRVRAELAGAVSKQLGTCAVLALPTLLVDIPSAGQYEIDLDGTPTFATSAMVRLTALFDHTGHPAVTVPLNTGSHNAFDSIQLVAGYFDDAFLLAFGQFCQQLLQGAR
ncbi:amidase [Mycolicibacterium sp. 624]|uniref:amidase n=1 Tax=Mycolicibacterium sp. 624 TaxID=3156314 RepID=UPI0033927D14